VAISGIVSGYDSTAHDSICVSISPGCYRTPGCRYCATGMVSERQRAAGVTLTVDEVAEQVNGALQEARKDLDAFGTRGLSLSFMGKGEPGLYPDVVMGTLARLHAAGIITGSSVATTGLPRYLRGLAEAYVRAGAGFPAPLLQVSIHAPFDAQRAQLVTNPQVLAPIDEVFRSAIEDYALRVLPAGTFITVRLTLMTWCESQSNFDAASLDELARIVRTHTMHYRSAGFGGIMVVVAVLNETTATEGQGIYSGSADDLRRTVARLEANGVAAREFAGGQVSSRRGGCGTLSCDVSFAPLRG
jgi:adenine C2-methylase RlmN of 23S rRNA A2503 and tRNA A37